MDDDAKLAAGDELDLAQLGGGEEAVRVFVRIRPLNKREIAEKQQIGWNYTETSMIEDTQNGQRVYAYDCCFGPNGTNSEVYDTVGKPVVLKAMEGYNGTVFTYGQTGSGKTWTMRGSEDDPGMMILCIRDIFEWMESHPNQRYTLRASYLEVYNEEINDLLSDGHNLRIVSEDAVRGAVIGGLVEEVVKTSEEFMAVLQRGEASRAYASTTMNDSSSRSHTIYRVAIEVTDIDDDVTDDISASGGMMGGSNRMTAVNSRISYLNLVDLAGSERQKQTNATGKTLKEGANINKSLLALGAVINKLGEACSNQHKKAKGAKPVFIPYRDSKLTRILKQSLGGNTLTSILCAVTPAPMHREETVSTLKFGQLCKTIKNNVKSNEIFDDKAIMKQYKSMISDLRSQLEELQTGGGSDIALKEKAKLISKVKAYENIIITNNLELPVTSGNEARDSLLGLDSDSFDAGDNIMVSKLLKDAKDETNRQNEKIAELQRRIIVLQRQVDEHHDFEEAKIAYEEYEHNVRQEMDDEKTKLEAEKQNLHGEKYKILADRTNLQEKEGRLGLLTANLDERDSKLRQLISTMKEQQEQWNRSIADLQRREDLVEEWARSHRQREQRLQEMHQLHDDKFLELNQRERDLSETDQKLQLQQRELSEREQRLQVAMSRVANSEQAIASQEEKLHQQETNVKKREGDCDIKERELQIRRREMESWDTLLREKDRKISSEQRALDERDENIRSIEDKIRHREADIERKLVDVRQSEALIQELRETYNANHTQLEAREKAYQIKSSRLQSFEADLNVRESNLNSWESALQQLQYRLQGIEEREAELKVKVEVHKRVEDEFFNVKVAQITARHSKEMGQLEQMLQQQLKIVGNFQADLTKAKEELAIRCQERDSFKSLFEDRDSLVAQLKTELQIATSENQNFANSLLSNSANPQLKASSGRGLEEKKSNTGAEAGYAGSSTSQLLASKPSADATFSSSHHLLDPLASSQYLSDEDDDYNNNNHNSSNDADDDRQHLSARGGRGSISGRHKNAASASSSTAAAADRRNVLRMNSSPDFLMQLADTQRLIHQILVNHNALPSESDPLLKRSIQSMMSDPKSPLYLQQSGPNATQQVQNLFNQFTGKSSMPNHHPARSPVPTATSMSMSDNAFGDKIDSAGTPGSFNNSNINSNNNNSRVFGSAFGQQTAQPTGSNLNTSHPAIGTAFKKVVAKATGDKISRRHSVDSGSPAELRSRDSSPTAFSGAIPPMKTSIPSLQQQPPPAEKDKDKAREREKVKTKDNGAPSSRVARASITNASSKSGNASASASYVSSPSIRGILRPSSAELFADNQTNSKNTDSPVPIISSGASVATATAVVMVGSTPLKTSTGTLYHNSPDISSLVERGERDGIPTAKVSLQFGNTRKLVNQVILNNHQTKTPTSMTPPPLATSPTHQF